MAGDIFSVKGKVAVVTGGSRGIGLMIADGLIEAGVRVYISSRNAGVCDEVARELSKKGECQSVPADLSSEEGIEKLASFLEEREPQLDILVNNAGTTWGATFEEYPPSAFDKVLNLNLKAIFHLTQRLLPLLEKASSEEDPSRVINIGSIDGIRVPLFDNFAYSAAKAGVHMLTRHMAQVLAPKSITVNAIAPGLFRSKMTNFLFQNEGAEELISANSPLKRIGRPEDMAGAVIYLSSRAGSFLTGAVIPVDGGVSTR